MDTIPTGYVAEMKESEFIQRARKDDDLTNNRTEENSDGVGSILPPTQHLQIRVSSKIGRDPRQGPPATPIKISL